jgi:hypothetical protein
MRRNSKSAPPSAANLLDHGAIDVHVADRACVIRNGSHDARESSRVRACNELHKFIHGCRLFPWHASACRRSVTHVAGLICYLCRRSEPEKTLGNFWVTREEMARVERKHLIGGFTFIQARSS